MIMTFNFTAWLLIALLASIIANIFAFWYNRRLLSRLWFVAENLGDLVDLLENYKLHMKSIYELEDYYGDQNIKFLLSHTTSLLEVLEDYEDIYNIIEATGEEELEKEEETNNAKEEVIEQDVFYAGTRRRNN
jgi:hypothetical protein